jgi:hypothetical protein
MKSGAVGSHNKNLLFDFNKRERICKANPFSFISSAKRYRDCQLPTANCQLPTAD